MKFENLKQENFNNEEEVLLDSNYVDVIFKETSNKSMTLDILFSEINAKIGLNSNELNENTIYEKALNFRKILDIKKQSQKILIYWPDKQSLDFVFAKILANTIMLNSKHEVIIVDNSFNVSYQTIISYFLRNDFDYIISFFRGENKNKLNTISFKQKGFKNLNLNEETILNKKSFTKLELDNFDLETKNIIFLEKESFQEDYINNFNDIFERINFKKKYTFYSSNKDLEYALEFNNQKENTFSPLFLKNKISKKEKFSRIFKKMEAESKKINADAFFYIHNEKHSIYYFVKKKNNFFHLKHNDLNVLMISYLKEKYKDYFDKMNFITLESDSYFIGNYINFLKNNNLYQIKSKQDLFDLKIENNFPSFIFSSDFFHAFYTRNKEDKVVNNAKQILFFIEMFEYYSNNNIDIFSKLEEIYKSFPEEMVTKETFKFSHEKFLEIISDIKNNKKIFDLGVKKIINFHYDSKNEIKIGFKLIVENGDQILLNYNKMNKKLEVKTFFGVKKSETKKSIVLKEQNIFKNFANLAFSDLNLKAQKRKMIFKFTFSLSVIFIIFIILFSTIYKTEKENVNFSNLEILKNMFALFFNNNYQHRIYFFILVFQMFFYYFMNALLIYRLMKYQKHKIKFKHVLISSMISTIVQNITPFSFGGDLISFWYLQKKKYDKHKLISVFAITSLLGQTTLLLSSIFLLPVGFYFFKDSLFSSNNPQKIITILLILGGIALNVIFTAFIILLANFKKMQYFIIEILIKIFKLNPWKMLIDPERKRIQYQIHFDKIKLGFRELFSNKIMFIETLFCYKIPLIFVSFSPIIIMEIQNLSVKKISIMQWISWYFKFLGAQTFLGMANNLSPLPGGIGSSDWLTLVIFQEMFANSLENVKLFNFSSKFFFWFIPNLFSSLLLLTVWIGEKRISKYSYIKNLIAYDKTLKIKYQKNQTHYFMIISIIWILLFIGLTLLIFLI